MAVEGGYEVIWKLWINGMTVNGRAIGVHGMVKGCVVCMV